MVVGMSHVISAPDTSKLLADVSARPVLTTKDAHGRERFSFTIPHEERANLVSGQSRLVMLDFADASALFDKANPDRLTFDQQAAARMAAWGIEHGLPQPIPKLHINRVRDDLVDLGSRGVAPTTYRQVSADFGKDTAYTYELLRSGAQQIPFIVPRETTVEAGT
jgi:hypothetical protein